MKFLFTCAGTAGHINPALAIAERLRELMPDAEFLFIGSGREMEKRLIPAAGFKLENITITGFSRGFKPGDFKRNFKTIRNLWLSSHQCKKIIGDFRPDVAIGTGGYVCYPVLSRAIKMKIPTVMHESNAIPGLTTKLLADRVTKMLVAFPDNSGCYRHPERLTVTGTPVRKDFAKMTKEAAKNSLGLDDKPLIVSVWGSLGAAMMNEYMAEFIKLTIESGKFNLIHSTGGGDAGLAKMKNRLREMGITDIPPAIDIRPYIDNMGTVMTAAELVLCRAGASTLAELTDMGVPAIIVPSPNVVNNHQEKNARALEKAGGCKMILEKDCNGKILYDTAAGLLGNTNAMKQMSENSKKFGVSDSVNVIVDIILSLLTK